MYYLLVIKPINLLLMFQKEIFGKHLKPGEFDKLSAKDQQDKSEAMIRLMQKWREDRRAKELARNKDAF